MKLQKESHAVPNEGGITPSPLILPKMMKPTKLASSYSTSTFPDNNFPKASFPKLHSTSMFPTLSEAFKKTNKVRCLLVLVREGNSAWVQCIEAFSVWV